MSMTASEVYSLIGHKTHNELCDLCRRLNTKPWLNTREQRDQLQAAQWALANRYAYSRECKWRRDFPTMTRNLWTADQLREFAR